MLCWLGVLSLPLVLASPRQVFAHEPVLLFPQSTVFQFTIGVSIPIIMEKKGGVVFSYGFQFNYVLPWNLSQFEPMVIEARAAQFQPFDLKHIYTSLEELLNKYGWRDGRACLLKTICELADAPISRSDVVEEIIHLLLTPSEDEGNSSERNEIKLYEEAEKLGKRWGEAGCNIAYPNCPKSPIDSFTELASWRRH